ncbi:MAG: phosphatidylserine decarboxylase family protein [Saprospiraceae bacterium]
MFSLLHKEGRSILLISGATLALLNWAAFSRFPQTAPFILLVSLVVYALLVQFFRNPPRKIAEQNDQLVYAPADGKVVVIEHVEEPEYFRDERIQVSIFMSPLNVHVNRNPVSGSIPFFRYHPGKYLVAWHPKSSEENERTTVVYDTGKHQLLMRQIAGAVARRIKWYVYEGKKVNQGEDMGFIKFGSRVDLFLPPGSKIEVGIDQKVKGNQTVIAQLP